VLQWECSGHISEIFILEAIRCQACEYLVHIEGVGHGNHYLGTQLKILTELEWRAEDHLDVELGTPNSSAKYRCHRDI
jgi:hypothetical protein